MLSPEQRHLYRMLVGVLLAAFVAGILGLVVHALVFGASVQYYDLSSARDFPFAVEPRPPAEHMLFLLGFTLSYLPTFLLIIVGAELIARALLPAHAMTTYFAIRLCLNLAAGAVMVTWGCFVGLELYITRGTEQKTLLEVHRLATYLYYVALYVAFILISLRGFRAANLPRPLYGLGLIVGLGGVVFASFAANPERSPIYLILGNVTGLALFMAPLGAYLVLLLSATHPHITEQPTYKIDHTPPSN